MILRTWPSSRQAPVMPSADHGPGWRARHRVSDASAASALDRDRGRCHDAGAGRTAPRQLSFTRTRDAARPGAPCRRRSPHLTRCGNFASDAIHDSSGMGARGVTSGGFISGAGQMTAAVTGGLTAGCVRGRTARCRPGARRRGSFSAAGGRAGWSLRSCLSAARGPPEARARALPSAARPRCQVRGGGFPHPGGGIYTGWYAGAVRDRGGAGGAVLARRAAAGAVRQGRGGG